MIDFNKVVVLTRSASGAGKSTFAEYLKYIHTFGNPRSCVVICEADSEMYENGEYVFRPEKLAMAHNKCREKFEKALEGGANLVICSNTNTRDSDVNIYKNLADKYGYTTFVVILENRNNTTDSHNVPVVTKEKQAAQLKNSIKLI